MKDETWDLGSGARLLLRGKCTPLEKEKGSLRNFSKKIVLLTIPDVFPIMCF